MNPIPEPDAPVDETRDPVPADPTDPPAPAPAQVRRRRRRRHVLRGLLGVTVLVVGYVGYTITPYLAAPGTDPFDARVAEWARDHHLGMAVTWLENETYSAPSTGGGLDSSQLAQLRAKKGAESGNEHGDLRLPADLPANIVPFAAGSIPGEGVFSPVVNDTHGLPVVESAALRPDAEHTSDLAYVAWLDQKALSFTLHPGYQQPGGDWKESDQLTPAERTGLVATWNGGFKVEPDDAMGGFYEDGRTAVPLVDGKAAEVFYKDGTIKIGQWGRDLHMADDVAAVRENLDLLVDDGAVTVGEGEGSSAEWGYTISNSYYIARSGVGVTAKGDVVYVGGGQLSVYTLAKLLKAAGAVNGMELDINPAWTSFMTYNAAQNSQTPTPTKLWDFDQPANRYYSPSDRDFVAVHTRKP